ncbi:MAG: glycosyltransferase family 4 protein [Desulfobacteraceae bacterium]|nr:glycosyltransferase family 4 protein [Desulfobacteraceae bacterium]
MNILLIAPQPFFQDRGTPIAVRLLAESLGAEGHSIHLLTYHEGEDIVLPNVVIHRSPKPPGISSVPPGLSAKKLICDAFLFLQLLRLLRNHAFDLIHAVEESVFMAMVCRAWKRIPYVYDMDSCMSMQILDKFPALRLLRRPMEQAEKIAAGGSVGILAVCPSLAETARGYAPTRPVACLEDIPLESDPAQGEEWLRERYDITGPLLMYVGNLENYQGIDLLLESFHRLLRREGNASLVIIGGSPDSIERYRRQARRLGIADRTCFCGPRPVSLLGFYLEQADILVSPRIKGNNTPMKIYSYLDSGIPVLATNLLTHTQVMDDEIACLVPPDPEAMAQGMQRLLHDDELRRRLGQRARQRVEEEYSLAAYRKKLLGFYRSLPQPAGEASPLNDA